MTTGAELSKTTWDNPMTKRYPDFNNEKKPVKAEPGAQGYITQGANGGLPDKVRHGAFVNVPESVLKVTKSWTAANPTHIEAVDSTTKAVYNAGTRELTATVTAADKGTLAGSVKFSTQAGNTTTIILIMALLVAYLVLAAQYESWTSPVAAVMGLPVAILGAMLGCWVMGVPVSIYTQIGIILLIALSAKNGILIVEFARDYRKAGNPIREAAYEAGHVRLRPILMTSFTFVLGVMPLLFATGAGAGSRVALGAAVVFGMAVNTIFATVYIPNWYEVMQNIQEKWLTKKQ